MNFLDIISQLANNGILGLMLALCLLAIGYIFNLYIKKSDELGREKDRELSDKSDEIEKITLVLREVDNTEKAILIDMEKRNEKK